MNNDLRQALRQAIDKARRNQIAHLRFAQPRGYCQGCGIQRDQYAPECSTCRERRRMRRKRTMRLAATGSPSGGSQVAPPAPRHSPAPAVPPSEPSPTEIGLPTTGGLEPPTP